MTVCLVTAALLVVSGGLGAFLGGAPIWKGSARVLLGGTLAMGATYGIGLAFGAPPVG
jgi:VIT1/CCC1 family predicted Fe2+/Mn2+ transporter